MASPSINFTRGSFTPNNQSIDIKTVGFRPKRVTIHMENGVEAYWDESMPDAAMHKRVAAGTGSYVTTNGITPLANGFRLGTDANVNPNGGTVIHWDCQE